MAARTNYFASLASSNAPPSTNRIAKAAPAPRPLFVPTPAHLQIPGVLNGIDALVQLYDMITSKFEFTLEIDGEKKTMTRDELGSYVRHPSPEVRAAVYQELYRVYGDQRLVLAQIYQLRAASEGDTAFRKAAAHYEEVVRIEPSDGNSLLFAQVFCQVHPGHAAAAQLCD